MNVVPFPSNRLTYDDLLLISKACCDLMQRGLVKGVVRVNSGDSDRILCVTESLEGCGYFGIGRERDGTYYMTDSKGESLARGNRLAEVLAAVP